MLFIFFFFKAEAGIQDAHYGREFRRLLFRSTTSARSMNISASVCWASTGFQLPDSAPTSASDHRLKSSRRSGGDAEQLGDDDDWERERQLGDEVAGAGGGGGQEVVDELRTDLA